MERVVIVSGVRTAVGDCGGSLKDVSALQLGAVVLKEVLKRAGVYARKSVTLCRQESRKRFRCQGQIPLETEADDWGKEFG